jgi:hypothetical protein
MRNLFHAAFVSFFVVSVSPGAWAYPAQISKVESPNGEIRIQVMIKEKLEPYPPENRLYYSITFKGRDILLDSPFGLDFKDMPPRCRDLVLKGEERRRLHQRWETVIGKSKKVLDAADSADFPERLFEYKKSFSSREALKIKLAPEGGFAIELSAEN